jgi:hypothetical protein
MLTQRIYGLAVGYEDLNDHEQLRSLLRMRAGSIGNVDHDDPAISLLIPTRS